MEISHHPQYFHVCPITRKRKDLEFDTVRSAKIQCINQLDDVIYHPLCNARDMEQQHQQSIALHNHPPINSPEPSFTPSTQQPLTTLPAVIYPPHPTVDPSMDTVMTDLSSNTTPTHIIVSDQRSGNELLTGRQPCPQCLAGESGHLMHIFQQQQQQ